MAIPEGITREQVIRAFRQLDAGNGHRFGKPTKYVTLFEDGRFAPKAVVGVAAKCDL